MTRQLIPAFTEEGLLYQFTLGKSTQSKPEKASAMANKSIVKKYTDMASEAGYLKATNKVVRWILHQLGFRYTNALNKKRAKLSRKFDDLFKSTVQYGPFKGLKLSRNTWWSPDNRAAMLFGLYEKEILESLQDIPSNFRTFVELGAADGYYATGTLVSNMFEKAICFEVSAKGRRVIEENARLNNVLPRVVIKGNAGGRFYSELDQESLRNSVLFVDIEGAEFELLNNSAFEAFRRAIVFVELHDWFFVDGDSKLKEMIDCSAATHSVREIRMGSRDPSVFPELETLSDNERWILCSEGRARLMRWLRFDPI